MVRDLGKHWTLVLHLQKQFEHLQRIEVAPEKALVAFELIVHAGAIFELGSDLEQDVPAHVLGASEDVHEPPWDYEDVGEAFLQGLSLHQGSDAALGSPATY